MLCLRKGIKPGIITHRIWLNRFFNRIRVYTYTGKLYFLIFTFFICWRCWNVRIVHWIYKMQGRKARSMTVYDHLSLFGTTVKLTLRSCLSLQWLGKLNFILLNLSKLWNNLSKVANRIKCDWVYSLSKNQWHWLINNRYYWIKKWLGKV